MFDDDKLLKSVELKKTIHFFLITFKKEMCCALPTKEENN